MINIDEFRQFVLFVMNKSGNGEIPTPEEFNRVVNQSIAEWTAKKIGNPQLYQPGRPIPPQSIDVTMRLLEDLRHLKESQEFFIASNSEAQAGNYGRVILPNGSNFLQPDGNFLPAYLFFIRLDAEFIKDASAVGDRELRPVVIKTANQVSYRRISKIAPPTKKYPIGEFYDTYIQVYPVNVQKVMLTYLREPLTAVWAYTIVNNRPVYNAAGSTDIDVPYLNKNDLAMIYLKYQGINLSDMQLTAFADQMEKSGV